MLYQIISGCLFAESDTKEAYEIATDYECAIDTITNGSVALTSSLLIPNLSQCNFLIVLVRSKYFDVIFVIELFL